MQYTVTEQHLAILGRLWMGGGMAAMLRKLDSHEIGQIADIDPAFSRGAVATWMASHCGDFSGIIDFRVDFHIAKPGCKSSRKLTHVVHDWQGGEESDLKFHECMYPSED